MEIGKENLLEELQSIKHCLDMTNTSIEHQHTREHIVSVLEKRITDLEQEVDRTISAQELGADMNIDFA